MIEIFNWLLGLNGKHVAFCFYMCRCASNWGFQICFQIYSAFWLILARACRMTSIMSHFFYRVTSHVCWIMLSFYCLTMSFGKKIEMTQQRILLVILCICCQNEMAVLKSHSLVERRDTRQDCTKNDFFNGSH